MSNTRSFDEIMDDLREEFVGMPDNEIENLAQQELRQSNVDWDNLPVFMTFSLPMRVELIDYVTNLLPEQFRGELVAMRKDKDITYADVPNETDLADSIIPLSTYVTAIFMQLRTDSAITQEVVDYIFRGVGNVLNLVNIEFTDDIAFELNKLLLLVNPE